MYVNKYKVCRSYLVLLLFLSICFLDFFTILLVPWKNYWRKGPSMSSLLVNSLPHLPMTEENIAEQMSFVAIRCLSANSFHPRKLLQWGSTSTVSLGRGAWEANYSHVWHIMQTAALRSYTSVLGSKSGTARSKLNRWVKKARNRDIWGQGPPVMTARGRKWPERWVQDGGKGRHKWRVEERRGKLKPF